MNFTATRSDLLDAVATAASVVPIRTPKPVLQCLKVTAAGDQVVVHGTDLELSVRSSSRQVQIEKPGECLVPADKLVAILSESTSSTVSFAVEHGNCVIRDEESRYKLFTGKLEDFPSFPLADDDKPSITVASADLRAMVSSTIFAAPKETAGRYQFAGILIESSNSELRMVSTDGRRLALMSITKFKRHGEQIAGAIVPSRAANLVSRLARDADDEIGIKASGNRFVVWIGDTVLATSLMEGQFADYRDILSARAVTTATIATDALLSAVKRAALMTAEESKGVCMKFSAKGLVITSRSPEQGEAEVRLPASLVGPDLEIGFNPSFLAEALRVIESDSVQIEMIAPNRPGIVRCGEYTYVLMPVNLN